MSNGRCFFVHKEYEDILVKDEFISKEVRIPLSRLNPRKLESPFTYGVFCSDNDASRLLLNKESISYNKT